MIVHIWCAAHWLVLVYYWVAKHVPYLKTVNETLIAIFYFFINIHHLGMQTCKGMIILMGKKVKRFKKPTQVRWLSMSDAVKTCFLALMLFIIDFVSQA